MQVTCCACKASLPRKDCHRNRYNESICRSCQAAGLRYTWRGRLQYLLGRAGLWLGIGLGSLALVLLLAWAFQLLLALDPVALVG